MRNVIRKLRWGRLLFLLATLFAGVAITIGLWAQGVPADPFVIPTLVGFTIMGWLPLIFATIEMLNYEEGWSYDGGIYRRHAKHNGRILNASVCLWKAGSWRGERWVVTIDDSRYDGTAKWSRTTLRAALAGAEEVMDRILYEDVKQDSPF